MMKKHSNKLSKWEEIMITGQVVASEATKKSHERSKSSKERALRHDSRKIAIIFHLNSIFCIFCFFS